MHPFGLLCPGPKLLLTHFCISGQIVSHGTKIKLKLESQTRNFFVILSDSMVVIRIQVCKFVICQENLVTVHSIATEKLCKQGYFVKILLGIFPLKMS